MYTNSLESLVALSVQDLRGYTDPSGNGTAPHTDDVYGPIRRFTDISRDRQPQEEDALEFTGVAYIAGHKTTGLGTKAWVRCFLDSGTAEDNDGPPPDPFPFNEEWYEVANLSGDIHITRA